MRTAAHPILHKVRFLGHKLGLMIDYMEAQKDDSI